MTTLPTAVRHRWTNQDFTLYHGTLKRHLPSILSGVTLSASKPDNDFGRGFYTTTLRRQAQAWAWQRAAQSSKDQPAVVEFTLQRDDVAGLASLWFVRGAYDADDFWSLVTHCRSGSLDHMRSFNQGWYDVVVGPVAAAWRQRVALTDFDQVSFHTPGALVVLNRSNTKEVQ